MKKFLCLLLTILIAAICGSCYDPSDKKSSGKSEDNGQLTYYYTKSYPDDMVEKIERYNRWCSSHSTQDMKIKLIEFDNYQTMSQRLNIEVMSGGGPDLFSNYMDLPFEKLMQNGTFYDLNEIIENDTSKDKIDLDAYNKTVMDSGLYNGKRYFIPAFYRVHTLIGDKNVFEKFNMPTEQGYHLNFDNMETSFSEFVKSSGGTGFMIESEEDNGINPNTVFLQLIDSQVNFENQSITFDEDFCNKLEFLKKLYNSSNDPLSLSNDNPNANAKSFLFYPYLSCSNPINIELTIKYADYIDIADDIKEPVLYSCFEKDEDTYSANIMDAIFVKANTDKGDKALAFIKYLLSERVQNLYAGTNEEFSLGKSEVDCLPTLNSALEHCFTDAQINKSKKSNAEEENSDDTENENEDSTDKPKTELSPLSKALIEHIKKINCVVLYSNLTDSNYNKNVALPILQDYLDGKTDINKCVNNLSSATKIYILE